MEIPAEHCLSTGFVMENICMKINQFNPLDWSDAIVIPEKSIKVLIDYPLVKPFVANYMQDGFSVRGLLKIITSAYQNIYYREDRTLMSTDYEVDCNECKFEIPASFGATGYFRCSLCWKRIEASESSCITSCKHIAHEKCIRLWLLLTNECPLCKGDVARRICNCSNGKITHHGILTNEMLKKLNIIPRPKTNGIYGISEDFDSVQINGIFYDKNTKIVYVMSRKCE